MDEAQAIDILSALSQQARLRMVRHLVGRAEEGASAGEIGKVVDATSSRAAFHLSVLEKAGVITSERRSEASSTGPIWTCSDILSRSCWTIAVGRIRTFGACCLREGC